MRSTWRRIVLGLTAFREAYFASDAAHEDDFESLEGRQMRYSVYWALFSNDVYRRIHNWSTSMKHQMALYKYTRNLYNPAYRLGTFYSAHMWGGGLDRDAGPDGAIPIETENETLRPAIATLWKSSNFATLKDTIALRGAIEGDVILRVQDDVVKGKIYLERVDPGTVTSLDKDDYGNVKGYVIEEKRQDPTSPLRVVTYREEVTRDGEFVVYQTFKNNSPFGWNGQPAEWAVSYTFVPVVALQHFNVGLDWGWSEIHAVRSKIFEADDLASMLGDQIRRSVQPLWLVTGKKPSNPTVVSAQDDETGKADTRPEAGREESKIMWTGSAETKATAMVANLNLSHALEHIKGLLEELERDYPELAHDIWATGATSGRALRVARQRAEAKIRMRREGYDDALVRAQQMAVAIGGMRGYEGFKGFGLDSYTAGALDHSIAERPVFAADPMDAIEVSAAFWAAAKVAVEAGANLVGYLRSQGWTDEQLEEIQEVEETEEEETN